MARRRVGPHAAALGRRVLPLGVVMALLGSVILAGGAGAIGVGGTNTPFGLTPAPLANGQSRSYFSLTISAGRSATDSADLVNESKTTETFKVSASTGTTAPTSGSSFTDF